MSSSGGSFVTINPATGERIGAYPIHTAAEIEARLAAAATAFADWSRRPVADRAEALRRVASLLRERSERYARLMTEEMGKPIRESRAEIEKCAWSIEYFADHAESFLAPEEVATDARRSYIAYDPLGPILAIMPWNFPFWQVIRFAAPAMAAGNVVLLKHAPNVLGSAFAIEGLFADAGFPRGAMQALVIDVDAVEGVIADRRVRGVTLTGSVRAGRAVAETAGRHLKKTVLELGGSDPFIVLDDADLEAAARVGAVSRCQNAGQTCIAAKRFIVVESRYDAFLDALTREISALRVGDPLEDETQVGPMAREDLRSQLVEQVAASVAAGARVVLGGEVLDRPGFFYAPTILTDVRPGTPAYHEELFGPAAVVYRVPDEEAAVALANSSDFGLGASIWTRDLERGERVGRRIEAGAVFVNGMVKSDPRLPFGGVKDSGYGRELSVHGMREFVNIRSVWIG